MRDVEKEFLEAEMIDTRHTDNQDMHKMAEENKRLKAALEGIVKHDPGVYQYYHQAYYAIKKIAEVSLYMEVE